jgi:hypothetical protein
MKALCSSLLLLALTLHISACENKALKDMEKVKDKICACPDQACVSALDAEFKAQEAEMAELGEADQKRAIEISLATLACATKLSN